MLRFALTIFTSAFLLFQVQPLIARYILPWFGGTPAVWSTCMLFFQLVLLAGYSYAHALNYFFKPKTQGLVHLVVLVLACLMLPIIPSDSLKPTGDGSPVLQILMVLGMTIGLPYFVVSTTGPLLQSWFATSFPGRSPYRLFALSNFGSLVALLTYPFLFEPYFRQKTQAYSWSGGFICFALLCGWCALLMYKRKDEHLSEESRSSDGEKPKEQKYSNLVKPNFLLVSLWIGLSMVPSVLLLATTNQVCQEIAVVPFLWVVPLALYLITFIICFEAPYLYVRVVFYPLFAMSVLAAVFCLHMGVDAPMWIQAGGLLSAFFFGSMVCHGELACNKPAAQHLTLYYLAISIGGALGGVFVVLCAPVIFDAYFELHVGLILAACLTAIAFHSRSDNKFFQYVPYWASAAVSAVIVLLICWPVVDHAQTSIAEEKESGRIVYKVRDFWGILTVKLTGSEENDNEMLQLTNGRINHGNQYTREIWRQHQTTYYCEGSGIHLAIERNPRRLRRENLRIAVVGLGTGTVAAWAKTGDVVRFYEINPEVEHVAENIFYYLRDAREKEGAIVDIVLGDARIQMQRQLDSGEPQKFDVIAVDAFSSDAIPRHLLTRESVKIYGEHLRDPETGIIAIHISNRFLDLEGICHRIGTDLGYDPILINCQPDQDTLHWGDSNTWVLLTKNKDFIADSRIGSAKSEWEIEWRERRLEEIIEEETGEAVQLTESTDYNFESLADSHAKSGVERFEELVAELEKPDLSETELAFAENAIERFLSAEIDVKLDLRKVESPNFDSYKPMIREARLKKITEMNAKWRQSIRQFKVLWTDDFGSLWQVIRMEFDWKKNKDELWEWWSDWWKSDSDSETDDDEDGEG